MARCSAPSAPSAPSASPVTGGVYLLAFYRDGRHVPYRHAGHYLGWAEDITRRIAEHRAAGSAANPLCAAAVRAGYELRLIRTWPNGTRTLERSMKDGHDLARVCPVCAFRLGDGLAAVPVVPAVAAVPVALPWSVAPGV